MWFALKPLLLFIRSRSNERWQRITAHMHKHTEHSSPWTVVLATLWVSRFDVTFHQGMGAVAAAAAARVRFSSTRLLDSHLVACVCVCVFEHSSVLLLLATI